VRTWHHKSQVRTLVLALSVPNYFLDCTLYTHIYPPALAKPLPSWPLLASGYKQTMIRTTGPRNRFVVLALLVFAGLSFLLLGPYQTPLGHVSSAVHSEQQRQSGLGKTNSAILTGHAIAPKLGNATVKYV
jgi:quinol-cytochrome oxidoreductase complex cytochrome b subunit